MIAVVSVLWDAMSFGMLEKLLSNYVLTTTTAVSEMEPFWCYNKCNLAGESTAIALLLEIWIFSGFKSNYSNFTFDTTQLFMLVTRPKKGLKSERFKLK